MTRPPHPDKSEASSDDTRQQLDRIIEIMRQLRDPETGCPWDVEQDFASIAPYTIEEAYEVADAVQRGDTDDIRDELGDLLLQVVLQYLQQRNQQLFLVPYQDQLQLDLQIIQQQQLMQQR